MPSINVHLHIQGIVQGVGFRPTVYLYAQKHHLTGWVLNSAKGVEIEVHGQEQNVSAFVDELRTCPPTLAKIDLFEVYPTELCEYPGFEILTSLDQPADFLPVSADIAICAECRKELFDPQNRRYRYPFINCTNCGPRFSIIKSIPYDRPNTSMAHFPLCPDCTNEYLEPADRRFHAQPVACSVCGPHVWFEAEGSILAEKEDAIQLSRRWLRDGKILAIKGLGGFHLACDAHNPAAVQTLRERKRRSGKPFALMAFNLEVIKSYAKVSESEGRLLTSSQAPIVLLETTDNGKALAKIVAPDQIRLGFMLPYTPLHLLVMEPKPDFPDVLIMTSGNISEEPIAYENSEALSRLTGLADGFLMHDRPVFMRVDDSVISVLREKPYFFRRARGFAPSPINLPFSSIQLLGAGTELKNTFCLARDNYAFVSHFIGDLENQETLISYQNAVNHYKNLFRIHPELIACDLHPDYLATRYAIQQSQENSIPLLKVQHHHAHIASCLAENGWKSSEPVIGLAYDGTGFGTDGTIWGGEIFVAGYKEFERIYHLAPVALPGGDQSIRKPARMALSYLIASGLEIEENLSPVRFLGTTEVSAVESQIKNCFNAPLTSSMGRFFDAIAALTGLIQQVSYEAQAAIALESVADPDKTGFYSLPLMNGIILPYELISQVVKDLNNQISIPEISAKFHNTIIRMSLEACQQIRRTTGIRHVAISGGVWQNQFLMKRILPALENGGFTPLYHINLPPNDGCVSLGQAMVALAQIGKI